MAKIKDERISFLVKEYKIKRKNIHSVTITPLQVPKNVIVTVARLGVGEYSIEVRSLDNGRKQ